VQGFGLGVVPVAADIDLRARNSGGSSPGQIEVEFALRPFNENFPALDLDLDLGRNVYWQSSNA